MHNNYFRTDDLYGPVRNAFDAGSIHYLGKWEGVGPWKSRVFWALWNGIEPIGGPKNSRNHSTNITLPPQVHMSLFKISRQAESEKGQGKEEILHYKENFSLHI